VETEQEAARESSQLVECHWYAGDLGNWEYLIKKTNSDDFQKDDPRRSGGTRVYPLD